MLQNHRKIYMLLQSQMHISQKFFKPIKQNFISKRRKYTFEDNSKFHIRMFGAVCGHTGRSVCSIVTTFTILPLK